MNQKFVWKLTGALFLIAVGVLLYTRYVAPSFVAAPITPVSPTPATGDGSVSPAPVTDVPRAVSVETYIKKHIREFSPVKEQLGGTFYVTEVEAHGGAGSVSYEDGHNAYTADFRYAIDEFGMISIDSFVVRP